MLERVSLEYDFHDTGRLERTYAFAEQSLHAFNLHFAHSQMNQ